LNPPPTRRARPDLTVFFSTLDLNSSSQNQHSHNTNENEDGAGGGGANGDAFRLLAQAWHGEGGEVMEGLIQQLLEESDMHKQTQGVPQEFLDGESCPTAWFQSSLSYWPILHLDALLERWYKKMSTKILDTDARYVYRSIIQV